MATTKKQQPRKTISGLSGSKRRILDYRRLRNYRFHSVLHMVRT